MQNLENLQLLEQILDLIKKKKASVENIATDTGIPASRIYSWKGKRSKPKGVDFAKLQIWYDEFRNLRTDSIEQAPADKENLSIQAIKDLTRSNLIQAESMQQVVNTNTKLADRILEVGSNTNSDEIKMLRALRVFLHKHIIEPGLMKREDVSEELGKLIASNTVVSSIVYSFEH